VLHEDKKLKTVFSLFDTDGDGRISRENLRNAFEKIGAEVPAGHLDLIMEQHDKRGHGEISFETFKQMFEDDQEERHSAFNSPPPIVDVNILNLDGVQ
jgi:calcium-binding protein CML